MTPKPPSEPLTEKRSMVENAALIIVLLKMDISFRIEEVLGMVVDIIIEVEETIEIEVDLTMTDETTVGIMIGEIMDEVPRGIWIEVIGTTIDGIMEGITIEEMIDGMIGGRREEIMAGGMIGGTIGEGLDPEVMKGEGIGLEVLMIEDARGI